MKQLLWNLEIRQNERGMEHLGSCFIKWTKCKQYSQFREYMPGKHVGTQLNTKH